MRVSGPINLLQFVLGFFATAIGIALISFPLDHVLHKRRLRHRREVERSREERRKRRAKLVKSKRETKKERKKERTIVVCVLFIEGKYYYFLFIYLFILLKRIEKLAHAERARAAQAKEADGEEELAEEFNQFANMVDSSLSESESSSSADSMDFGLFD